MCKQYINLNKKYITNTRAGLWDSYHLLDYSDNTLSPRYIVFVKSFKMNKILNVFEKCASTIV